jgi:hypothetical protein
MSPSCIFLSLAPRPVSLLVSNSSACASFLSSFHITSIQLVSFAVYSNSCLLVEAASLFYIENIEGLMSLTRKLKRQCKQG